MSSVTARPDQFSAEWYRQQWMAACYQQNVYAASIRELELSVKGLQDAFAKRTGELESALASCQAEIGQLRERVDAAAKYVAKLPKAKDGKESEPPKPAGKP